MDNDQTVLQAKRLGVFTCQTQTSLDEAARTMVDEDVSALIVVDEEGFLVGLVSRIDLLKALLEFQDWREHPVVEVMATEVVSVSSKEKLTAVARMLLDNHIHRVVVVRDEQGMKRPVAVVSAADLVYHMVRK